MNRFTTQPHSLPSTANGIDAWASARSVARIDEPDRVETSEAIALSVAVSDVTLSGDDAWLEDASGGRGAMPLALALLAGALGSGHALPAFEPGSLVGLERLAPGARRQVRGLRPGWETHALPLIREFEGLALEAYVDPVGLPTIGYGTIHYGDGQPVQLGDRISVERAEELLRTAVAERYAPQMLELIPAARHYSAPQQAALVSFTYNVGVGALQRSTLRQRLLAGEDPKQVIAEELPRWCRGDGRELPGLVRRRAAEVALFQQG